MKTFHSNFFFVETLLYGDFLHDGYFSRNGDFSNILIRMLVAFTHYRLTARYLTKQEQIVSAPSPPDEPMSTTCRRTATATYHFLAVVTEFSKFIVFVDSGYRQNYVAAFTVCCRVVRFHLQQHGDRRAYSFGVRDCPCSLFALLHLLGTQ